MTLALYSVLAASSVPVPGTLYPDGETSVVVERRVMPAIATRKRYTFSATTAIARDSGSETVRIALLKQLHGAHAVDSAAYERNQSGVFNAFAVRPHRHATPQGPSTPPRT